MPAADREQLEQEIRTRSARGDLAGAAEVALRGYGPEIYGFLHAFHRSEQDAAEVFSAFTERLWRGLPSFAWDCSFRTWAYVIARNAARTHRDQARRHARGAVPLEDGSALSGIAEQVRSETAPHLRTETKSRVARLREALTEEQRMVLSLRIDRNLAWNELARILHDGAEPLDEAALKRESARHRKAFQGIKETLAELARREGLLGED